MRRSDFQYELPDALIARHPPPERSGGRLLHLDGRTGHFSDRRVLDLPSLLRPGDLLVCNDTRVIPARLFGVKDTGGKVELMLERVLGTTRALVQMRSSKPARPGTRIQLAEGHVATVVGGEQGFWTVDFDAAAHEIFERHGEIPLPPYLARGPEPADRDRYQTVYAREPGAVAAPTAGLHFDEAMFVACRAAGATLAYVTLHVGAGTFQSVRVDDLSEHRMHAEVLHVPAATVAAVNAAQACGGRVVAIGTTSVRALEAAAVGGQLVPFEGETRLFLTPGARFRVVDALVTNFHLPESTLLMLVCAFAGHEHVMRAYRHAVDAKYRFFSYGAIERLA